MSEWQPIETAPKDGRHILLFAPGYRPDINPPDYYVAQWRYGMWSLVHAGGYAVDALLDEEPSHWMPLPNPPSANL